MALKQGVNLSRIGACRNGKGSIPWTAFPGRAALLPRCEAVLSTTRLKFAIPARHSTYPVHVHLHRTIVPPSSLRCPSVPPPFSLRSETEGRRRDNVGKSEGYRRDDIETMVRIR